MKLYKSILSTLSLCLGFTTGAQNLDLGISFPDAPQYQDMKVFVKPVNASGPDAVVELSKTENGTHQGEIKVNPDGLYYLYCTNSSSQTSLPIYIPAEKEKEQIDVRIAQYNPATSLTDDVNNTLSAYATTLTGKSIELGTRMNDLSDAEITAIVNCYITAADSITNLKPIPDQVKNFINLWAYTSASDAISMVNYMSSRSGRTLTLIPSEVLPEASSMLDSPMAIAFPSALQIISSSLPKGSLDDKLSALNSNYKTPEIKDRVSAMVVDSFLSSFDYANNFEEGEKQLSEIIKKYSLTESYLDTFRSRRATITGTPFPAAALVDRDGNPVDFSKFRGKYVYVDLWASWCGPCCKEVPHLQALEKELEDSNVVFVSISIDSTKEPWLKKMDQLKMHGNQLWNSDGDLPKRLNVRGIPHFLIYDPQGNLHTYNAPRPSSEQSRALLESLK